MEFLEKYSGLFALALLLIALWLFIRYYPEQEEEDEEKQSETVCETAEKVVSRLDLNDEDATVACLVAAIECRNETHKNVQIVSVREVK